MRTMAMNATTEPIGTGAWAVCALVVIGFVFSPLVGSGAPADAGRIVAAARAGDATALQGLVHDQADANASSSDGTTALQWAAHRGDVDAVNVLLARGANANSSNRYGVTALRLACEQGHEAVAAALLAAGADPNAARPESGETPV